MSKTLTLLAALFVVIAVFLMMRNYNNDSSHSILTSQPMLEADAGSKDTSNFHEWREYSFKPEHFKVLLPSLPQHVSDKIADPKTKEMRKYETFASAADNGAAFMVNAISFSTLEEAEAGEETLKDIVNEMLTRNKENKLNEMKKTTFHGLNALDFSFNNENLLIEGKVFAYGKTMYILSMINKKEAFNKKELDFFINSFDFVDEKLPPTPPPAPLHADRVRATPARDYSTTR